MYLICEVLWFFLEVNFMVKRPSLNLAFYRTNFTPKKSNQKGRFYKVMFGSVMSNSGQLNLQAVYVKICMYVAVGALP